MTIAVNLRPYSVALCAVLTLCTQCRRRTARGPRNPSCSSRTAHGGARNRGHGQADDRLYPAPAESRRGAAIVVCPGGGYGVLASDHEGQQVAKWLNTIGVTAAVLKYRLGPKYHHPAALQDVQRAIRYVRSHASELQVAPDRIGVMGFSAGGHLASTISTHLMPDGRMRPTRSNASVAAPIFRCCVTRPSAWSRRTRTAARCAICWGRIRSGTGAFAVQRDAGDRSERPPAFLFHTAEDTVVPAQDPSPITGLTGSQGSRGTAHLPERAAWRGNWRRAIPCCPPGGPHGRLAEAERVSGGDAARESLGQGDGRRQTLTLGAVLFFPENKWQRRRSRS